MINRKAVKSDIDRIKKLDQTATSLEQGAGYYSITRLTSIKSLCKEPEIAALFCMYLATLTYKQVKKMKCPKYHEPGEWKEHQQLMELAVTVMESYLKKKTSGNLKRLWEISDELVKVNDNYKQLEWGPVRIIKNTYVLLIEYAMQCMLHPSEAGSWAYQTARHYAERYETTKGTGLIKESVPLLKDIVDFWAGFYSLEL